MQPEHQIEAEATELLRQLAADAADAEAARVARLKTVQCQLEFLWRKIEENEYSKSPKVIRDVASYRNRQAALEEEEGLLLAAGREAALVKSHKEIINEEA